VSTPTVDAALRVVVLSGAPGVGKTEVGRRLAARGRLPTAAVDADRLADVHPWSADEAFYRLLARNVAACLPGYREWGVRLVVLSAVLLPGRALDHFSDLVADPGISWRFFGLRAAPDELRRRLHNDQKFQGMQERLSWGLLDSEVDSIPGVTTVDTTDLTVDQVVDRLAGYEPDWFHPRAVPGGGRGHSNGRTRAGAPTVRVDVSSVRDLAVAALAHGGISGPVGEETAADLIAAERAGVSSHGLLRIPEYAAAVAAGTVDPQARPTLVSTGGGVVLDGRRAPGVVVRRFIGQTLVDECARRGFALVAMRDGAHLGRLRPLAEQVTAHGLVLIGWVNFSGVGQKVAPPGAATGRIATNPIVVGCPAPPGQPVILDMSTSVVSEGAVRAAQLAGELVSGEALQDALGRPVRDPTALYTDPPSASLSSLGGVARHKGFGLAVLVEVLAGIVAGGGFVGSSAAVPGNAGLFIAFPADALGRDLADIGRDIRTMETHLTAPPGSPSRPRARVPGRGVEEFEGVDLVLPVSLWVQLTELASGTDCIDPEIRRTNLDRESGGAEHADHSH
jgi:LDH2 family malate/lactate/ureidoglycolate dehydrogenase